VEFSPLEHIMENIVVCWILDIVLDPVVLTCPENILKAGEDKR